ncbi:hypothetical protein LSH36_83g02058 [Paralvinella palmiformis]|uniref:Uncharacterized protein n=1 Tax=Paralvinella palmiformis TaxID=53620 RepID=A0AAD9NDJ1_9ANNE|nr:hypothetical protein LSH36_83g02058 [Paralvinella palmiformis]
MSFIHATNSPAQLKALKQCLRDINQSTIDVSIGSTRNTVPEEIIIRVLVAAMMQAHPRNQSRRAISSALQMVRKEFHVTIKDAIKARVVQMMDAAEDISSFRYVIDNVTTLIDNFELG